MKAGTTSPSRLGKRVRATLLAALLILFAYVTVGLGIAHRQHGTPFSYRNAGTDLTFRSSDGLWAAEEDLIRGRHFPQIVAGFELYKIQCNRPDVTLVRTKPMKRPWNWAYWFDRHGDAKWRVPYVASSGAAASEPCAAREPTANERLRADQEAARHVARLAAGR